MSLTILDFVNYLFEAKLLFEFSLRRHMSLASCRHSNSSRIMGGDMQTKSSWLDLCADWMKPKYRVRRGWTVGERKLRGAQTEHRDPLRREDQLTHWRIPSHVCYCKGITQQGEDYQRTTAAAPSSRHLHPIIAGSQPTAASQPFGPALLDVPAEPPTEVVCQWSRHTAVLIMLKTRTQVSYWWTNGPWKTTNVTIPSKK